MTKAPHADSGMICPLMRRDVSKCCHLCAWYISVRGKHPQSGVDVDNWVCAVAFTPIATLDAAHQTRSNAAATEDLRNEVVKANSRDRSAELTACLAVIGRQLKPSDSDPKLISG